MTRKSKREIERAVDDLDGGDADGDGTLSVVFKDNRTGDYYESQDMDGDPVDPDDLSGPVIAITGRGGTCVMMRDQAEREGREILGPAEDAPADDAVRVVWED